MRPDGTRVKEASTIVSALPYVMPRRYDAQNFITEYADMEVLRRYIQEKRREGVRIPYMTLIRRHTSRRIRRIRRSTASS